MTNPTTQKTEWEKHLERVAKLEADRRRILALSSDQAYREILDHPQPTALIHSFAEEDFFFLVHEIGPFDALELLAMASDRQWEYILDVEIWQKDQIHLKSVTHWLHLLLKAAPSRFTQWAMTQKPELIEFYLYNTVDLCIRSHDQDPSELDGDFFTFDDVFYIRLIDPPEQRENDPEALDAQQAFLADMLKRLAMADHYRYQETLLRAANVLPAESEEEAYRFRNVRLAEKGFLPFDEAVGVYQPISAQAIQNRQKQIPARRTPELFFPVPLHHAAFLDKSQRFTRALSLIQLNEVLQQIQTEFAGLCNRIAAADQKPIYSREDLRSVVKKACGYLEIGFERLVDKNSHLDDNKTAVLIKTYPLIDIFRLGYGLVLKLRKRAKAWRTQGWFANNRLALSFWDEYLVGMIGGLLVDRPRFFDNYETEGLYREFASLADIKAAHRALKQAMAFDDILSCMGVATADLPEGFFITYKNLLLTLWTRNELHMAARTEPVPVEHFKAFYQKLWEEGRHPPHIREEMKSRFLTWLSGESGFTEGEIADTLGKALESLFAEIAGEYGDVAAKDLDPRFVPHFLLCRQKG
ncbi:MAG TPA: DUF6178 family protein [Desulfosalsimonadaceae bacterium]|nr:DUF6178 family protein [Desulfosalsimonadaceae bacterium]